MLVKIMAKHITDLIPEVRNEMLTGRWTMRMLVRGQSITDYGTIKHLKTKWKGVKFDRKIEEYKNRAISIRKIA